MLGDWFGREEVTFAVTVLPDGVKHISTFFSEHASSTGFSSTHLIFALLPALIYAPCSDVHTTFSTGLFFIVSGVSDVLVAVIPPSEGDAVMVNGDVYVPATVGVTDH